jgi:hypothetical protein
MRDVRALKTHTSLLSEWIDLLRDARHSSILIRRAKNIEADVLDEYA